MRMVKSTSKILVLCVIIAAFATAGIYLWRTRDNRESAEVEIGENEVEITVEVRAADRTLHYAEKRMWREDRFQNMLEDKAQSKTSLIKQFGRKYEVNAENFEVYFEEEDRITVLTCSVPDKISESGNRYTATFLWFLNPQELDFIENDFVETRTDLSWRGKINGTRTIITIDLPPQDSIYNDWGEPVGHCHGHVWWPTYSGRLEESLKEREIRVSAENRILHYQETRIWSTDRFEELVKDKSRVETKEIENFKKTYDVKVDNFRIEFNRENCSTTLKCDIYEKLSGKTYTFHWFLNPHNLNLIENDFEEHERKLVWQGNLDGTSTIIVLKFPFELNHCHAHVWPA